MFKRILLLTALLWIGRISGSFAQTQTTSQQVPFSTTGQSMWGAGGGFSLNMDQEIFRFNPSINFDTGNGGIANLGGFDFGAGLAVNFWMDIGSNFKIQGLTLGTIDVNYPITVNLTYPADNTFEKGDTVTIQTGYQVDPAWDLTTHYPTGGKTSLDLHFGFGLDVDLTLCAFGCATIPIIPNLQLPVQYIDIFAIQTQPTVSATYPCVAFSPCGGGGIPCLPSICTTTLLPVEVPANGLGIGGEFNLPYVVTDDSYDPTTHCLYASGEDDYMTLSLDIFAFLDNFASRIPPPAGTIISGVIGNLSNSFSLPFGAVLEYTIFAAQFNVVNSNTQDFSFCPRIESSMAFPMAVKFWVTDPTNGNQRVNEGFGTLVKFILGNQIHFVYPCNYEFVEATPTYDVAKTGNNFSNHTYDVISFNFAMQALYFNFELPELTIIPEICIPEICVRLCWPNPSWSNPFRWSCGNFCTPAFCIPALVFPGFKLSFGPLLDETIPLGSLPPINYFNESWNLGGFKPVTKDPIKFVPRDYTADLVGTNIACKGDSTGTATVTITNGKPPYKYVWDNLTTVTTAAKTQSISGLEANTHYVVVTNGNGCVTMDDITLYQPLKEVAPEVLSYKHVSCKGGNDGQIAVSAKGGTGAYTYSWSSGLPAASTVNGLIQGSYLVKITDALGCDTSANIVIQEPLPLALTHKLKHVTCFGISDGFVDVEVQGGTTPYSYSWSNGTSGKQISQVAAGVYALTVTDALGCTLTQSFTINQPVNVVTATLSSKKDVSCKDGRDGAIDIIATGGVAPYQYQWYTAANLKLSASTNTVSGLTAGTYSVLVQDANGCKHTSLYNVNEPAQSLTLQASTNAVSCFNGNDGSIQLTVQGGTPGYTYNWSQGATQSGVTGLAAGLYTVSVSDSKGCVQANTYEVTQPRKAIALVTNTSHVKCFGEQTGKIETTISGGTMPYTYSWSNGVSQSLNSSLAAGSYTVSVLDAKGCTEQQTVQVQQPSAALNAMPVISPVSCKGGADGAISLSVQGGTAAYYYQWANEDSVVLQNRTTNMQDLKAGEYTLLLKDANGCSYRKRYLVSEPANAIQLSVNGSLINCKNDANGTATSLVSGGTAPYSYSWSNGNTASSLTSVSAGTYSLQVTDAKGCSQRADVHVTEPEQSLTVSTKMWDVKCKGGSDGRIESAVSGGTAPYTYSWSNGSSSSQNLNLTASTYTLKVTDAKGCSAISGGVITEPTNGLSVVASSDSVTCYQGSDGKIAIRLSGGTLPYQIQFADSMFLMNNVLNKQDLDGLTSGMYLVRVYDGNGCVVNQNIYVPQPNQLTISAQATPVSCFNGSDGTVSVTVNGGTQPYTYSWNNNANADTQAGVVAGHYYAEVVDKNGCKIKSTYLEVQQPIEITWEIGATQITCKDKQDATAFVSAFGGVGNFTYNWSNGFTDNSISDLAPGVYKVTISDANACMVTDSVLILPNTESCIEIATAFTPNSDGKNDTWIIYNLGLYPNCTVKIFNQWGNLLFESNGYATPWDGMFKGNPLPSATYYYIIDLNNGDKPYTGPITIIR